MLHFTAIVELTSVNPMTFDPAHLIATVRELAAASQLWHPIVAADGTFLFEQGDPAEHVWILEEGLVKLSYFTVDGQEWTKSLVVDCGLFAGSIDWTTEEPCRFAAKALENSQLVQLPIDWFRNAIAANSELQSVMAAFGLWLQSRKQQREEALLCQSAEQRYLDFLASAANLSARLPQQEIAKYIGITPVALSRIRRRLGIVADNERKRRVQKP